MKVLDANLLVYAVNSDAPLHRAAKAWFVRTLSGTEAVGIPWLVILTFIRLTTRPGLLPHPLPPGVALDVAAAWLEYPSVTILHPGPKHLAILRGLLTGLGMAGNLTPDAHLAALAIEHGAELCSCDLDFGRFPGLRWLNPLSA